MPRLAPMRQLLVGPNYPGVEEESARGESHGKVFSKA